MKRLDEIEARANAATEGPWRHVSIFEVGGFVEDAYGGDIFRWMEDDAGTICATDPDAEFTAHARQDVPALVAVARFALSQHAPDGRGNCGPCDDAQGEDGWPCSTVREIHRLLGEGD